MSPLGTQVLGAPLYMPSGCTRTWQGVTGSTPEPSSLTPHSILPGTQNTWGSPDHCRGPPEHLLGWTLTPADAFTGLKETLTPRGLPSVPVGPRAVPAYLLTHQPRPDPLTKDLPQVADPDPGHCTQPGLTSRATQSNSKVTACNPAIRAPLFGCKVLSAFKSDSIKM